MIVIFWVISCSYTVHVFALAVLKDIREHLHIKLLRYLTYALNHYNPIVSQFANIALRCSRSPMGANIALLHYLYDVSFDMKQLMSSLSVIRTSYIMIMSSMQQSVYWEI